MLFLNDYAALCIIAVLAATGVIIRPFGWPEAIWALAGAMLMVVFRLLPLQDAWTAVMKGSDVYLFLTGMMLLSETARVEGLFDWLAALAARQAGGSATKLFLMICGVGTAVTVLLSNDATAVVLTPAVAAAVRAAEVKNPLPYLLICAFIANAASFVLPISNPANLVIYGSHMPSLRQWLSCFMLPSALSIIATCAVLYWIQRPALGRDVSDDSALPRLSGGGKIAGCGIIITAIVLLASSALDTALGLPTAIAGAATATSVLAWKRKSPWKTLQGISWSVLPLVAGLFVLVEGLGRSGVLAQLSGLLHDTAQSAPEAAFWAAGIVPALAGNLMNNLPAGLIAGDAMQNAQVADRIKNAVLIGIDLGPNLSVTGSLATLLWLTALRREGQHVGAWEFLKLGMLVMPPALLLALASLFLSR